MLKRLTGFTYHKTSEGERLSYKYSEIDGEGNVTKSNQQASLIVLDEDVLGAIETINEFLTGRIPE